MTEESPASALAQLAPGVDLEGYTLLGARSRGAMGIVYAATEKATGRRVAVKVLRQRALRFAHTFARERDALHALSHPNVVQYLGHGETPDGLPYLVTEWLDGEDLEAMLARGKLSVEVAIGITTAVARALGAAHAQGIVHRDVKPANVHIGVDGAIKLLDFGVAHVAGAHAGPFAVGTALYMAPEQVRAAGNVDARSDVYALGCVLFECLTGRPPFSGERATVVLAKAIFEPAPRLASFGVIVSPSLEALIAQMLSKRTCDRPASGDHTAVLLRECPLTWDPNEPLTPVAAMKDTDEQRIGCVALVRTAPEDGDKTTMVDGESPRMVARLVTLADEYGVELDGLFDGTLLVTARDLEPVDQGARIARFSLALVAAFPDAGAALATGTLGGASSAIERAEDLLRRTFPGEVRTCPTTARVLDGKNGDADEIVGRDDTVKTLLGVSSARRTPRAALLTGEPGMGKTCILHEVARRLESSGRRVILIRGEMHRAGSPLAPFAAWLRHRFGLEGGSGDAAIVRAAHHDAAALLRIAGVGDEGATAMAEIREPVERALVAFLVAEARAKGAVVIVDDAQWLDAASLRILEWMLPHAMRAEVAVLVFGRPEALALLPSLGRTTGRHLELGPLSAGAARELALATNPELGLLDPAQMKALLDRADGHPFVVRELARAASEGLTSVPDTVLGIVQARLARLPDDARRAARAGALLGMQFSLAGVSRLLGAGDEADLGLEALVAARIVQHPPSGVSEARYEKGGDLSFTSPLVRDATYELLMDDERALWHARAARWFDEQPDRDPAVVAWHEERGGDPPRAARAYAEAAKRALAVGDIGLALAHTRHGIGCGPDGEALGLLRLWESEALLWSGEIGESFVRSVEAMSLLAPGSVEWLTAMLVHTKACGRRADVLGLLAISSVLASAAPAGRAAIGVQLTIIANVAWWLYGLGRFVEAEPVYKEVLRQASSLSLSPDEQGVIHRLRANRAERGGEWSLMIEEHTQAANLSARLGERTGVMLAHLNIASAHTELGMTEGAITSLEATIEGATELGLGYIVAYSRYLKGRALRRGQRPDEAEEELSRALQEAGDDVRVRAQSHTELALLALDRGDVEEAKERADLAIELSASLPSTLSHALSARAEAGLRENDVAAAVAWAERAAALAKADFPAGDDPSFVWRVYLDVLVAARRKDVDEVAAQAHAELLERAVRAGGEDLRPAFLAQPDNARILAHARAGH